MLAAVWPHTYEIVLAVEILQEAPWIQKQVICDAQILKPLAAWSEKILVIRSRALEYLIMRVDLHQDNCEQKNTTSLLRPRITML